MDHDALLATLAAHGILLQSARGPVPNVAELVAGEPISGSWWGHAKGTEIFNALGRLDDAPEVHRMRLLNGKVTFVHRRLWPALARLAGRFTPARLAVLHEEHTASGAHRTTHTPFPDWVTNDVRAAAEALSEADALALLPACLTPR